MFHVKVELMAQSSIGQAVWTCAHTSWIDGTNLSSENNWPTSRLNAPVKVKRCKQILLFIAMHYWGYSSWEVKGQWWHLLNEDICSRCPYCTGTSSLICSLIPRFPPSLGMRPLYFLIIHTVLLAVATPNNQGFCFCATVLLCVFTMQWFLSN